MHEASGPAPPAVVASENPTYRVAPAPSLAIANAAEGVRPPGQFENVLKGGLGSVMVEPVVHHQPLDDPAPEAEIIEPARRVPVERLGVDVRPAS